MTSRTAMTLAWLSLTIPAVPAPLARSTQAQAAIVGLDHIPIAVNDLERAAERFRRLGFVLKPGRPHDNGLRNEHAKFPDGTELELITAPEARDTLTTRYRKHLADADGPAFLAFHAPDRTRVTAPLPPYVFLAALNHSPTDRPEHFAHPNGATSFISVWLAADDLSVERRLLESSGALFRKETVHAPDAAVTDVAHLQEGEVVFLPGARQRVKGRPIVGATLRVTSVDQTRRVLARTGTPVRSDGAGRRVFVAPEEANGLWLEFRETGARR